MDARSRQRPEATVIIPTRDRPAHLRQAVVDAAAQRDVAAEIIVVDDGSLSPELNAQAVLGHPVRLLRHPRPRGVSRARNTGIDEARGDWIAFLDDDDRWSPSKLRTLIDAARSQGALWAYSGALTIDDRNRVLSSVDPSDGIDPTAVFEFNPIPGGCSNVIVHRDLLGAVGGFDEQVSTIADWDLWIRLFRAAPPAVALQLLVGYRLHRDNMHVRDLRELASEMDYLSAKYSRPLRMTVNMVGHLANSHRRSGNRVTASLLYLKRLGMRRQWRDLGRAVAVLLGERVYAALRATQNMAEAPEWLGSAPNTHAVIDARRAGAEGDPLNSRAATDL